MARPFQPENFGRYLLTERIATGGMAEIFNAKVFGAMGFEKNLVIKRILPQFGEDTEFLRMFITEAKLVCHLEHPNIVQVHELGEIEGQYYIAMEYVNGIDARHLWRTLAKRKQRLPGLLGLFIVSEFLKGLDYAHRAAGPEGQLLGVVHRDVSPSNILLSYRGDVKIGDFGIALVQQESKTQAGVLKGKFGYMSPEQVAGMKVDHRSDIFAAGIVLAELLLGRRLFLGQSDFETLDKVLNVRLDVLDEHEGALPPEVVRVVRQALQRETDERFQSAQEFGEAIVEFLYERRARISNETLAAFIAEHVAPYLVRAGGSDESSGATADSAGSPVIVSNVLPQLGPAKRPVVLVERPDPVVETAPPAAPTAPMAVTSVAEMLDTTDEEPRTILGIAPTSPGLPAVRIADHSPAAAEVIIAAGMTVDGQFGALPVYDMGDGEGMAPADLAADTAPPTALPSAAALGFHGLIEGSGEALDLDQCDDEEDFAPPAAQPDAASILVSAQLRSALNWQVTDRPDFMGKLSARTMAKVLFRFSIAKETGLLVLSGPEAVGEQAETIEWLRTIQARANAEADQAGDEGRTCSIHLLQGQPHLISADRSEEALVAFLVRTGVLENKKVQSAVYTNPHRKPVAALLAAGLMAPLQVSRHVTAFVLDVVLEIFSWTVGEFAFYRGKENPSEAFPSGEDVFTLITRGVARIPEPTLDGYLRPLVGRRAFPNLTPVAHLDEFQPTIMLQETFHRLASGPKVEDVLAHGANYGELVDAKRALYLLFECELATVA
jgi:serine/threonine protein kinase